MSQDGSSLEPETKGPRKAPSEIQPAALRERGMDVRGDPLPPGAVARFGTRRFQFSTYPLGPVSALDGKAYLVYQPGKAERGRADFRWMNAANGKMIDGWPVPLGPVFDAETGKPTQAVPHEGLTPVSLSSDGRWAVFTDTRVLFTGIRPRQEKPDRSFNFYVYDLTAKKKAKDLRRGTSRRIGRSSLLRMCLGGRQVAGFERGQGPAVGRDHRHTGLGQRGRGTEFRCSWVHPRQQTPGPPRQQ